MDSLTRSVDAIPAARLLSHSIVTLVDAQRQAAGARLVSLESPWWFVAILLQAIVLFYFWRSGNAARLRETLRNRLGSEFAVRFFFGAVLALIARVAAVIPSFILWRIDRVMGLSHALTRIWAYEYVLGTILGMLVAGVIAAVVLWLVDRTHQWYLYTIGAILAVFLLGTMVSPFAIAPLFERYAPFGGVAGARASAFAARHGYAGIPIVVEHRIDRIPVDAAKVQGMGVTQRIVLADTLVSVATPGEIEFYVADEVAALDDHEPLRLALIDAGIFILGVAIAVVIADRIPFRRDDDPVSRLALVGVLLALVYIGFVPVDHAVFSSMQLQADRQAVVMTGDPASALRAFVRAGDERVEQVCPNAFGRVFIYRSPPLGAQAAAVGGVTPECR